MTPEVGAELANPVAGTRTVFRATASSTAGGYVEVEATYPPHGDPPPLHHHPSQHEHFIVRSGSVTVVRGGERFVAEAGEEFDVPAGVPHQMWCDAATGAAVVWRTTPALRTGEMFCDLWAAARDADWRPTPLALFEIVTRYAEEFRLD